MRDLIWGDADPYAGTPEGESDIQGWGGDQPVLFRALRGAKRVAEIGVWKGATAIKMARETDAHILCVDHFRGSSEHFLQDQWCGFLPHLYDIFRRNVLNEGLAEKITPLPLDSRGAFEVCRARRIEFDLIHIDGAHDYDSVGRDLDLWSRLTPRIVVDDYDAGWPGVQLAVAHFAQRHDWTFATHSGGKALLVRDLNSAKVEHAAFAA